LVVPVAAVAGQVGQVFLGKAMPEVLVVAVPVLPEPAPEVRVLPIRLLDLLSRMAAAVAAMTAQALMRVEELGRQGFLVPLLRMPLQIVGAAAAVLAIVPSPARVAMVVPGS
jgi:hypothetical protein